MGRFNRRRGKPRKDYINSLQKKPSKADWERLVSACIEVLIEERAAERPLIDVAFAYVTKLPKGFPAYRLVATDETRNIYRINVKKLYLWLYEKGYAKVPLVDITSEKREFSKMIGKWERGFLDFDVEDVVDINQESMYNIETEEEDV
jgi:hypothetical protein